MRFTSERTHIPRVTAKRRSFPFLFRRFPVSTPKPLPFTCANEGAFVFTVKPLFRSLPLALLALNSLPAHAQPPVWSSTNAPANLAPANLAIEAEDFQSQNPGWKVVFNGEGNYMVDAIGYSHISGERLLSAPANATNARAVANVTIPQSGTYKGWARFEQPVGTENRFTVVVRQNGRVVASSTLGEASATKYFFGLLPVPEAGGPWGWDGLVEQDFSIGGLQSGPAQIELVAISQPQPNADRNVDLLFLTQDLKDNWRTANPSNRRYPLLDAALAALPTRYYLRLTSPKSQNFALNYRWNRIPWRASEGLYKVEANVPGAWLPLRRQDVTHFSTLNISAAGMGLDVRAELSSDAEGRQIIRTVDWRDEDSSTLSLSLPPYPGKYPRESVQTVEEHYQNLARYLQTHAPSGGREPSRALTFGNSLPVWEQGRVGNAAADVYRQLGMRAFVGFVQPHRPTLGPIAQVARERFDAWKLKPSKTLAIGAFRNFPTPENIDKAKVEAEIAGVSDWIGRFDYGDEISFSEWLKPIPDQELKARFVDWQQKRNGKVVWDAPDSSHLTARRDPNLFVDSMRFYEDTAIETVSTQASALPKVFGPDILYGANYLAHPYYYPRIAPYIKWFRPTSTGNVAANFGRHSQYGWQVHQPGPMVDGYIAEHFRAGMRDNPRALLQQYVMPHAPGNTDESFWRSSMSHLAHGARALDFFGIGVQSSDTENYIDFRSPSRHAAVRDVTRYIATIEDILPQSQVVPSKVALILSESTERWDLAPVTADRAGSAVEGVAGIGANNPRVRLSYHQERVGLYYALINANHAPDLLTEADVQNGRLKDYAVAYWVGDCAEGKTVSSMSFWVENGGHLVATAGAMRFDEYQKPVAIGHELLGIAQSDLNEATRFVRPLIELPRLRPLDDVNGMPALAVLDSITPAPNAKIGATFKSGKPAILNHVVGRGQTTYISTLPGLSYLWSAYQPAPVPTHGPGSHVVPQNFNKPAAKFITAPLQNIAPTIDSHGARIDARLLSSTNGFAVPIANYARDSNAIIALTLRGISKVSRISSARRGAIPFKRERDGEVTLRYAPGIGDILRIEP